jgi:arginyl-tRNA synthetase
MLSAEGDTGVYLQYAHARFASIGRKVGLTPHDAKTANLSLLTEPHAFAVLRALAEFPEMVLTSLKVSEPSTIVTYLFKISHLASTAYETLIVKGAEPEIAKARYAVYLGVQTTLANGMRLLGLTPLERM